MVSNSSPSRLFALLFFAMAWTSTKTNPLYELDCENCDFKYSKDYTIDPKIPYFREMDIAASDLIERYMIFPQYKFPFEGIIKSMKFVSEEPTGSFEISICKEIIPNEKYRIDYSVIVEHKGRMKRSPNPRNAHGHVTVTNVFSASNKLSKVTFKNKAQFVDSQKYNKISIGFNETYVLGVGFTHSTSQKNKFLMFSSSEDVASPVLKMVDAMSRESVPDSSTQPENYEFDFKIIPDLNIVPGVIFEIEAFCPSNCLQHMKFYGRPACDRDTGACSYGCKPGWDGDFCDQHCPDHNYGSGCAQMCNKNCANRLCDTFSGVCKGCKSGYYGKFCMKKCGFCADGATCDQDGSCPNKCDSEFDPPLCMECRKGYYQKNHTHCTICGNCLDSKPCHKTYGSCYHVGGCQPGFILPMCMESCQAGRFGYNCTNTCGHCKQKEQCSFVDGVCEEGCDERWHGPQCNVHEGDSDVALVCDTASGIMKAIKSAFSSSSSSLFRHNLKIVALTILMCFSASVLIAE